MKDINTKKNSDRQKILIIDDAEDLRQIYVRKFKEEGFDVLEAKDGLDGLNVAFENKPNLIITGIMMPRVDGFEVINTLKKDAQTKNIPILVFSHLGRQEDIDKAMALGADDFLIQATFSPDDVVEKVRSHLGRPKGVNGTGSESASGHYNLNFDLIKGDSIRLARDLDIDPKFECPKCSGPIVLDAVRDQTRSGKWIIGFFKCLKCSYKP